MRYPYALREDGMEEEEESFTSFLIPPMRGSRGRRLRLI